MEPAAPSSRVDNDLQGKTAFGAMVGRQRIQSLTGYEPAEGN